MLHAMRSLLTHLCLSLLGLIMGLATVECALRLLKEPPSNDEHPKLFIQDATLGWKKRPSMTVEVRSPEYEHLETTNSLGLLGPEIDLTKDPDQTRILILGDSYAEGYSVPASEHFASLLQLDLSEATGKKLAVVNAGTIGYSTDQQLLQFRELKDLIKPQIVLLFFFYNDILYNTLDSYWIGPKPYFELNQEDLIFHPADLRQMLHNESLPSYPWSIRHELRQLELVRFVSARIRNNPGLFDAAIQYGVLKAPVDYSPGKPLPLSKELQVFLREPATELRQPWQMTETLLNRLNLEVKGLGAQLFVVYVPSLLEVDQGTFSATIRR